MSSHNSRKSNNKFTFETFLENLPEAFPILYFWLFVMYVFGPYRHQRPEIDWSKLDWLGIDWVSTIDMWNEGLAFYMDTLSGDQWFVLMYLPIIISLLMGYYYTFVYFKGGYSWLAIISIRSRGTLLCIYPYCLNMYLGVYCAHNPYIWGADFILNYPHILCYLVFVVEFFCVCIWYVLEGDK